MQFDSGESESHALRGEIDVAKLDVFRDAFVSIEPMASGTIDPRELRLTIPYDVRDAAETKFTVRWTAVGDYNVHYSDTSDHNLRWDIHPDKFSIPPDDRHFHLPPDASNVDEDVEPSCIDANQVALVAKGSPPPVPVATSTRRRYIGQYQRWYEPAVTTVRTEIDLRLKTCLSPTSPNGRVN